MFPFAMRRWVFAIVVGAVGACGQVTGDPLLEAASNAVVIKADDFKKQTPQWSSFVETSRAAGVRVSIGAVARPIRGNASTVSWMRAQEARGDVEFWNHGWDHGKWIVDGTTLTEFRRSGLAHQRDHLTRAQAALQQALDRDVEVFGAPYNRVDADTAAAVNDALMLRVVFTNDATLSGGLKAGVLVLGIVSEADGTGKPNAAKFEAAWTKRSPTTGAIALQFHPEEFDAARLDEYRKIVTWLRDHGASILLPSELLAPRTRHPN